LKEKYFGEASRGSDLCKRMIISIKKNTLPEEYRIKMNGITESSIVAG